MAQQKNKNEDNPILFLCAAVQYNKKKLTSVWKMLQHKAMLRKYLSNRILAKYILFIKDT